MNMKRLAKGLSLLLCLGIFVGMTTNNVWAATTEEQQCYAKGCEWKYVHTEFYEREYCDCSAKEAKERQEKEKKECIKKGDIWKGTYCRQSEANAKKECATKKGYEWINGGCEPTLETRKQILETGKQRCQEMKCEYYGGDACDCTQRNEACKAKHGTIDPVTGVCSSDEYEAKKNCIRAGGTFDAKTQTCNNSEAENCTKNGGKWKSNGCDYSEKETCLNNFGDWTKYNSCDYSQKKYKQKCLSEGGKWNGYDCEMPETAASNNEQKRQQEQALAEEKEDCIGQGAKWVNNKCDYSEIDNCVKSGGSWASGSGTKPHCEMPKAAAPKPAAAPANNSGSKYTQEACTDLGLKWTGNDCDDSAKVKCENDGGRWFNKTCSMSARYSVADEAKKYCERQGKVLNPDTLECDTKNAPAAAPANNSGSGFKLTPVTEAECKNLPDSQWDASAQKCVKKQASSDDSGTSAAPANNSGLGFTLTPVSSEAECKNLPDSQWDASAQKCVKKQASSSGSETNTEEADRMNDYYQECIGEYGDGAPECDKFKSGSGSSLSPAADGGNGSNPLNGGSAGSTMGAYEDANAKFVECQKLEGEAQEKCMAEYDALVDNAISKGEIAEATGKSSCPALSGENLFDYLACRITDVVRDLRMIVYILACFGMVGFAYSAIIGKINWKQLANIAIGLFILSMTTSIIEYIAYGRDGHGTLLKYGNHLPNGNHAAYSQNMEAEFDEKSYDLSGLDKLKSDAEGSSWSWKDLKSTIKSAKNAVDTAAKTYQTVKSTVNTTVQAAKNISNAIKKGGNPLDVAATIASNVGDVTSSVNYAANMAASAASTISNDIRDARSSGAQREYLDALRSEYDKLNKKCSKSATSCNRSELDALARLKGEMDANTTSTDKWLNNQGQNILNTVGNVNNIAQKAEKAGQAAQQGAGKGRNTANKAGLRGTLGDLLSFGYGVTEGVNAGKEGYNDLKENGSFDFRSQKTKDAEAEAAKAITDGAACTKAGGSMVDGYCKCPEGRDMVNNKCQKIKGKKGTTTTTTTTSTATEEKKEESKTEEPKAEETKDESKTPDSSSKGEKKCADGSKPSKAGNCCGALGLASDGYCNCPKGQSKSKGHCCPANTSWNERAGKCDNNEEAVCSASGKVWYAQTRTCGCPSGQGLKSGKCTTCKYGINSHDGTCKACPEGKTNKNGKCV